ncbi:tyrosine-protein kinase SRK3-like [Ptychodera flava]|uniref:tyrosine-protein kinase SRK3-like n=1 Tax=Ptychodera flava TaxID=63121 RepID=UPI00396AAD65
MKGKRVFIRQLMAIDNYELFKREVTILRDLNQDNVIKLYGVSTEPLCIAYDYMEKGTLLDFLRTNKKLSLADGITMSSQIAKGVAYIGSKGYVHRDVAARNVLVGHNNVCKLSDFKMAGKLDKNGIYEMTGDDRIPIKWTAKEVLLEVKCTIKSDVWSFGILLSEIVTRGQAPYPGMTNAEVQKFVVGGYHMPRPENCPRNLYDIMLSCWESDPTDRPSFQKLQRDLAALKL